MCFWPLHLGRFCVNQRGRDVLLFREELVLMHYSLNWAWPKDGSYSKPIELQEIILVAVLQSIFQRYFNREQNTAALQINIFCSLLFILN